MAACMCICVCVFPAQADQADKAAVPADCTRVSRPFPYTSVLYTYGKTCYPANEYGALGQDNNFFHATLSTQSPPSG